MTGFMGQFGTYRFLSMFEMMAIFIGEEKHGMWRFQENGFIRVYRDKSKSVGILKDEKEDAIESGLHYIDADNYARNDRLLSILKDNYMNIDPALDFDYAFVENDTSFIKYHPYWGREVEVLNWIDLPIYHEKFTQKYENHVPIDTPAYFCQVILISIIFRTNQLSILCIKTEISKQPVSRLRTLIKFNQISAVNILPGIFGQLSSSKTCLAAHYGTRKSEQSGSSGN